MIGQRHLQALGNTSSDPTRKIRWRLICFFRRHIQELDVHAVMEIEGRSYEVPDHVARIVRRVITGTAVAHGHGLDRVPEPKSAVLERQHLSPVGRLALGEDEELRGIFLRQFCSHIFPGLRP